MPRRAQPLPPRVPPAVQPRPAPARVPPKLTRVTPVSREERRARARREEERSRLTPKLIDEYCTVLRTGAPPSFAARYVGTTQGTVEGWLKRADAASRMPNGRRTQVDRLAMRLRMEIGRAESEAGLRIHRAVAGPGGVLGERPRLTTRTTTTRKDGEGHVVETVTVTTERDVAPEWRAAAHLGKIRFPEEMGGGLPDDETPPPTGAAANPRVMWEQLQQLRALQKARAITAESTDTETGT